MCSRSLSADFNDVKVLYDAVCSDHRRRIKSLSYSQRLDGHGDLHSVSRSSVSRCISAVVYTVAKVFKPPCISVRFPTDGANQQRIKAES